MIEAGIVEIIYFGWSSVIVVAKGDGGWRINLYHFRGFNITKHLINSLLLTYDIIAL